MKSSRLSQRLTVNRIQNQDPNESHNNEQIQKQEPIYGKTSNDNLNTIPKTPKSASVIDEKKLEEEFSREFQAQATEEKKYRFITKVINILLIAGCVYMIFLIYGVSVTEYQYNTNGQIEAQKLSVSDIRKQKNYEHVLSSYLACRALYEKTLMLDYRLGAGEEEPMVIAPEYEALLTDVEDLSVKTDALQVDAKYEQIKSMLLTWIKDDIAVYLQNMSAAISQNDEETANNALQDKDRVYEDFSLITQNMVATGQETPGVDLTDLKSWTPEDYINQAINGE